MKPTGPWRLLDTGARSAAANIALDSVLLEMAARGEIPGTIRFLQFVPAAALIGRHQIVAQEIRQDYCLSRGMEVNRRLTGGGAVYLDTTQIGWEVIASRRDIGAGPRLQELTAFICRGVVSGLELLGVTAAFRPRNDIEVDGRKLCGTGGAYEGDAFLFQGTLLMEFDPETMVRALKVPAEKLSARELDSARGRVTCLQELLPRTPSANDVKQALAQGFSRELGVELAPGELTPREEAGLDKKLPFHRSEAWVNQISEEAAGSHPMLANIHRGEGGLVRSCLSVDLRRNRIKSVLFTGDFFIRPARAALDLEASLRGVTFDRAEAAIHSFFSNSGAEALGLGAQEFWLSLKGCLDKLEFPGYGISLNDANRVSVVGAQSLPRAAAAAKALLLPYCAKLPDHDCRNQEGCDLCGGCTVGEAYELALAKGLKPVTIQDYEHLLRTFAACRRAGISSFIGCCCRAFLARRHRAFSNSGLDGVIIDIESTTCYDLEMEEKAYRGGFMNQTHLRLDLLKQVLALVPGRRTPAVSDIPESRRESSGGKALL
ncbi:MAG: DUF116 domain-containing protein [Thermoleophilia bacterium]|nr:DUF116 domain-containing protein [Thermoleophilia bacterium]